MAFKFDLRGLLEDENFLVGAGLLTAGAKGQSLAESAFPTIVNAAKTKKAFEKTAPRTKSVYDNVLKKNVLKSDKDIQDNPDRYEPTKTTKDRKIVKAGDGFSRYVDTGEKVFPDVKQKPNKQTMDQEVLAVYSKLKVAKNDKEFKQILDGLSKPEQQLYYNKIVGNVDMLEQAIAEKIENQVKLDIPQIAIVSEYKLGQKVEGYANALEVVEAQMANNPDASFEQVLQSLIEAGIIEK